MRIIYFTTALAETDFQRLNSLWIGGINPSHQSYHNQLINILAENNELFVISKRPFSRSRCTAWQLLESERNEKNIKWNYLRIPRFKLPRRDICLGQSIRLVRNLDLKDTVIMADLLNPVVSYIARVISKKFKLPLIGIARESPSNIIGTTKTYSKRIFLQGHLYSSYICATDEINETFNPNNRPSLVIGGFIKKYESDKNNDSLGKYIFYSGSCEEKYGIFKLIEAFKKIEDENLKLVIVGQTSKQNKFLSAIKDDQRIKYLGILQTSEVRAIQKDAFLCVNPAPYNEDINRFCFPQKTIEYFSTSLTLTTRNAKLDKNFKDCCLWHDGKTAESIEAGIRSALSMSEEQKNAMVSESIKRAESLYSSDVIEKKIIKFCKQLIK